MRNPFKKDKLEGEVSAAVQEGETGAAGVEQRKQRKKRVRFRISLKNVIVREPEDGQQATEAEKAAAAEEKAREKERKRQEKEERKKEKEEAAQKKREKPQKIERGKGAPKPRPPILLFLVIGAVVLVGGVVAAFLLLGGGEETAEDRLLRAAELTEEGEYQKSSEIYEELLAEDSLLAEAYLGLAENRLAEEDGEGAILTLTQGFEATQDPRLDERLKELQAEGTWSEEGLSAGEPSESQPDDDGSLEPIVWQDPALEKMMRMALEVSDTDVITVGDVRQIRSLKIVGGTHAAKNDLIAAKNSMDGYTIDGVKYTEWGEIRSLRDMRHFTGLTKLTICYNQVGDLSGLEELTELKTLGLYCNSISDITPVAGLEKLSYLYLYGNQIRDISPLSGLVSLESLSVQYNQISDLSPLKGLSKLSDLYLNDNEVTDISAVSGMSKLHILHARNNKIEDISPIQGLEELSDFDFDGNPVGDYSAAD